MMRFLIMLFILVGLVLGAKAGVEYLGLDLTISWTFPEDDYVMFELAVPVSYRDAFGWIGIALQDARDARDSFSCDYYIAPMETGLMTDRFAQANGFSETDEDLGCTTDLDVSSEVVGNYFMVKFGRHLITPDKRCDIPLYRDKPLMVKYAIGPMIDGNIEQHSYRYHGLEYVVLSETYEDKNNDERFVYGPWMVNKFQLTKWFEEYGDPVPPGNAYPE